MAYKPPVCDGCGESLELLEECNVDRHRKIRKDGKPAKRSKLKDVFENGIEILACPNCGRWHQAELDEYGRYISDGAYRGMNVD